MDGDSVSWIKVLLVLLVLLPAALALPFVVLIGGVRASWSLSGLWVATSFAAIALNFTVLVSILGYLEIIQLQFSFWNDGAFQAVRGDEAVDQFARCAGVWGGFTLLSLVWVWFRIRRADNEPVVWPVLVTCCPTFSRLAHAWELVPRTWRRRCRWATLYVGFHAPLLLPLLTS